jgi:hypothetical protein
MCRIGVFYLLSNLLYAVKLYMAIEIESILAPGKSGDILARLY